jgi:hypothetical protein
MLRIEAKIRFGRGNISAGASDFQCRKLQTAQQYFRILRKLNGKNSGGFTAVA